MHGKSTRRVLMASLLVFRAGFAANAGAATKWAAQHPRRAEVDHRLAHQSGRINKEYKESEISRTQASSLHRDDRQIRQEERDMASQNRGHITRLEQRTLNQQENQVSRQIGQ